MANNRAVRGEKRAEIERQRKRLQERKERLGSYPALADALGVNVRYVYEFLTQGKMPKNKRARIVMGLPPVLSRGAQIYRALNDRARAAGWDSWSAYRLAVLRGEIEIAARRENAR